MKKNIKRTLGIYDEGNPGPLIFAIAGMHGNEHAGIDASQLLLKMLEVEHISKPHFKFNGRLVILVGNVAAAKKSIRYIDKDLNRIWYKDRIDFLKIRPKRNNSHEELEMMSLLATIEREIARYKPKQIYVIDLHTTSADGGIFVVPSESEQSMNLAINLNAPVVSGMIAEIQGAALQYFDSNPWNIPTAAVSFESGKHDDPQSVYVAIAAVINLLRNVGSILPEDVANRHTEILQAHSSGLPVMSKLNYIYKVSNPDIFSMIPGFKNFQEIKEGTKLAYDAHKIVYSPQDALILMPLYQKKGHDGFFLVSPCIEYGHL
jgi:succinylglutamate desuccinylase